MSFRVRFAFLTGFGLGYYLGAKAGEERYKQIRQTLDRARRSELVNKIRAGVDLGIERFRRSEDGHRSTELGTSPA